MKRVPIQREAVDLVLNLLRARFDSSVELGTVSSAALLMDVLKFAGEQGVAPALAEGLRRARITGCDQTALEPFLDDLEKRNLERNLRFRSAATSLSRLLSVHDVECVFLKGATLLFGSNGPAAWREMTDLDVLVMPDKVARAAEALSSEGYELAMDPSTYREEFHHHYAPLCHPEKGVTVELHVRLAKDPRNSVVKAEEIFARAEQLNSSEGPIFIPCAEHRVAHLIAHAQISNWGYPLRRIVLRDVAEAAELSSDPSIDWIEIEKAFASIGASRELVSFLRAVSMLVPSARGMAKATQNTDQAWAREAVEALFVPQSSWTLVPRIMRQYVNSFVRNPVRLKVALKTATDATLRRRLISFNRKRIGWRN